MTARLGTALYTHYYGKEFPERFHDIMDSRRWTPGERIVFEPCTKEVFGWRARRPRRPRRPQARPSGWRGPSPMAWPPRRARSRARMLSGRGMLPTWGGEDALGAGLHRDAAGMGGGPPRG